MLVNVWTLWCPPCRSEMPALEQLERAHRPDGLDLVGVNVDARGDARTVRSFIRSTGVSYGIWLDPDARISEYLPMPALPATWLVDRSGHVTWSHVGKIDFDDPALAAALRDALHAKQLAAAGDDPTS